MANTEDLRYVRTETAIRGAFMELVGEGPVAKVTASAVCRRAGISRNAFYLHHASVDALYAALVGELVGAIRAESLASADRRIDASGQDDFEAAMVSTLAEHEDVLRALFPSDDGSLARCLSDGIEEAFVEAALRFGDHGGSFEHRLRCAYAAWALVGFAQRWVAGTDRPLTDSLPRLRELQAGVSSASAAYLLGKLATLS